MRVEIHRADRLGFILAPRCILPLSAVLALASPILSLAGVVTVCTESNLTVALNNGGLVTFACDGTISLGRTFVISRDTILDASGRSVTISGNGTTGIFTVNASRRLTLVNLTFSDALATVGGAIRNDAGVVTATNCFFLGNVAAGSTIASGGAIYSNGGSLNLVRCIFSGNRTRIIDTGFAGANGGNGPGGPGGGGWFASGGAIWNSGLVVIQDCYLFGNTCTGGGGGAGGTGGAPDVSGYVGGSGGMGGNGSGGAVYHVAGLMRVTGCTFASNSAAGGIGGAGGTAGSSIFGAPGGAGGTGGTGTGAGIHAESGTVLATNNTWHSNLANGGSGGSGGSGSQCIVGGPGGLGGDCFGGAIFAGSATAFLVNNTLAQNAASAGAGGAGGRGIICGITAPPQGPYGSPGTGRGGGVASIGAPTTLAATIFAFNLPGGNCLGSFIDGGFNISSDSTFLFTNEGGWNNLDPKLISLADNGGLTSTMALQPDSPAIDHCISGSWPGTDQRGVIRTNGLACDAGAYELVQPPGAPPCDAASLRASVAAGG